jgi:ubiquitin C-terminal hydrolase
MDDGTLESTSEDHKSMADRRPTEELTLDDCMKAFNESETLDDDNPWFCPSCDCNQRAKKSLSIWRSPNTLMVYLKRFVFHEMSSIKVDDPVEFPIDTFDMTPYIQGPVLDSVVDNVYFLQSYICHYGSVNSGHYTAFAKHCASEEWFYLNDKSVYSQLPKKNDERAYILFYQRSGSNLKMDHDLLELVKPSEDAVVPILKEDLPEMGCQNDPFSVS